ncbi:MAG: maleylacetoacetate isomerase [Stenotrophobium sp.]
MLKLYSYWRSSASYRVRIALNLKGLPYDYLPVSLVKDGGQQNLPEYLAVNPQGRVPFLVDGDFGIGQSLAILDYLDAGYPQPALIPADARIRARMWAFCQVIAADIQPLQNTGPLAYMSRELKLSDEQKNAWVRHWIERGFSVLEQELRDAPLSAFVFGEAPTLADCVLVPQMFNAGRYRCDTAKFPRLHALAQRLNELPAFAAAHPDRQPDARN